MSKSTLLENLYILAHLSEKKEDILFKEYKKDTSDLTQLKDWLCQNERTNAILECIEMTKKELEEK